MLHLKEVWSRPRTCRVSQLAWERLGVPPEESEEVAAKREVWASLLDMDEWMDGFLTTAKHEVLSVKGCSDSYCYYLLQ